MRKIWIIPPIHKVNKKKRVAAYRRVSTFGPAQLHSLDTPIEAYTRMIKSKKDWRFVGVFYDVESELRRKGRTELDNLPQYQIEKLDIHAKNIYDSKIHFTFHLDENLNIADFNDKISQAYVETILSAIEIAKELKASIVNMYMAEEIHFKLLKEKSFSLSNFMIPIFNH